MKRWYDLILEADFPWNIDEKYCEQAEWMMLLGSVLAFCRSRLERHHSISEDTRNAANAPEQQPSGMVLDYAVCFFGVECFLCRACRW